MELLAFKVLATPLLMLVASPAARRWGESIGGFVVGLPLTSGPISLFLALERGPAFAAAATSGSLIATAAQAAVGYAYCRFADRGWPWALAVGVAAFAVVAVLLQASLLGTWPLFALALLIMGLSLRFSPRSAVEGVRVEPPRWDLPARMVLIASLVVGITLIAPSVGPVTAGVLAAFPFMGVILSVFAHRMVGPAAGQQVMRGMVAGLLGFAVFFWVLGLTLGQLPTALAYAAAVIATLAVQAVSLRRLRRSTAPGLGQSPVE